MARPARKTPSAALGRIASQSGVGRGALLPAKSMVRSRAESAIAAQALPIMQMTRREVWPCLAAPERVCGAATVRLIPIVPAG